MRLMIGKMRILTQLLIRVLKTCPSKSKRPRTYRKMQLFTKKSRSLFKSKKLKNHKEVKGKLVKKIRMKIHREGHSVIWVTIQKKPR